MTPLALALALGLATTGPSAAPSEARPLPFLSDDYAQALAQARARDLPLFVEAWAPWCHTCRSMRAFVFNDPALASQARRFVWLELNTDLPVNERALRKHQADALPTFLVVEPKDETVVLRWVGSLTVSQAEAFLREAHEKARGSARPASPAEAALARADRLYGARDYKAAAAGYREALAVAPAGWSRYARAVESLLFSYQATDAYPQAVALARQALPRLADSRSALAVAVAGLDSSLQLPEQDAGRREAVAALEAAVRAALERSTPDAAADDRSDAYRALVAAREASGDPAGARHVAAEWARLLEAEAAKAKNAEERAVFDSHRLSAYLQLGEPEKAITMLEASAREQPRDYNPPNRLARAYAMLGRWDESLAASARAASLSTGRARLRVLATRAELLERKGDLAAARSSYDEAIAYGESLPAAERPARQLERLRKERERLVAARAGS